MCLIASLNDCHLITMDNWNFSLVRYMCVSMFVCLFVFLESKSMPAQSIDVWPTCRTGG